MHNTRNLGPLMLAGLLLMVTGSALAIQRSGDGETDLVLKAADTVEFMTNEGTWISLDVMPDGERIIFELLGDLYMLPLEGGTANRITEGMAYDSQPRVSPDGQWIAFISDRDGNDNLWIVRTDGSEPRKLSSEQQSALASPSWTPDSQYVVATRRVRRSDLRMYHVDGGSGISLDSDGGGGPHTSGRDGPTYLGAVVSPEGRYVYVAQSTETGRSFPLWQIARLDLRSGDVDVITQAEGSAARPVLSPDGTQLVYATRYETRTGLRLRDLETGADRWLIWPVQRDEQESGVSPSRDVFPGYAFTPDGLELVVTSGGKILRVDVQTSDTRPVPFEAHVQLDVGPDLTFPYRLDRGPVRAKLVQDPVFSPDGSRLAFSVLTKVYIIDSVGGTPRRLTDGESWEFKPTWSPDGEWIAFVTWSMDGGQVWRTRSDGSGQPQRLTEHAAFYTDVVYSPDGDRIVGLRGNAYMRRQTFSEFGGLRIPLDLVWLPATGGAVRLVVPARGIGAPHFGDDPDRIYVYSEDGLISVRYNGTDRRTHLKVTGPRNPRAQQSPPAQTVLMRPDGRWALASVNNQLWVIAVPLVGGDAATVAVRSPSLPAKRLTDIGADYFAWAERGQTITWAIGSTVYRRAFDTIVFGAGEEDDNSTEDAEAAKERRDPLEEDTAVEPLEIVLEFPRAKPSGTVVLRNATVITMNGDEILQDADIVVTDDRITEVGVDGKVTIPNGAREIDLRGNFVVPGFIDTHAHWEFRTHDVLEPQNWSLIANLAYGVTTGLDVQTSTNDYLAYHDLVETGQSLGQRALMTGPGVFSTNDFQSYEATLNYLRRYKEHYRIPNIKSYMVGTRKQRQWVVQASLELGLMPTTEGGRDMKMDLTHAIDGMHGNEHTLPVFPLYRDVVQLFARTRTAYTPTLLVQYGGPIGVEYFFSREEVHDDPKLKRFYPHNRLDEMTRRRGGWMRDDEFSLDLAAAQAAKIQRAGGLVGVGGHGELQGLGYHWEMWALAMGGMTPLEVLRAATIDGARIIGIEEDLGSIDAGKLADLVVLDADPVADIRNTNTVRYVMKNGELFEGDTLMRIWPSQRELAPFWWWNDVPPRQDHIRNGE